MKGIKHKWNISPKSAIEIQKKLRAKVRIIPLARVPKYIAGADVSMNLYSKTVFAGFVVLTFPEMKIVDQSVVRATVAFPYIPGLLSFREIPALLKAWRKLSIKPDLVVVDGAGIAHPRRVGIATHLGLQIATPTIGCAKSLLIGDYKEPGRRAGSTSYLYDHEEVIGCVVRTKDNTKPVFISPGHRITLTDSLAIIKKAVRKHRLPEPTRLAHEAVNTARRLYYQKHS